MIFLDYETCGFHGVAVLLQYAEDDGEINLHDLWREPVSETLQLLEYIATQDICGFNLVFDWFHTQKIYSVFSLFANKFGLDAIPENYIDEIAELEADARTFDFCIKPRSACDLMLHARKGPYQSLMARKDIRIKKVPAVLSDALARELEKRIEIDGIYFSRRKDKHAPKWQVFDREEEMDFKDVVLKFSASGALKVLAQHVLGVKKENILNFVDIEVDPAYRPYEVGWAPYATALSSKEKRWRCRVKKNGKYKILKTWPTVVQYHIDHWGFNELAREYGTDDVKYTRSLYKKFDSPPPGDDDSELACMVGSVRWRGFSVDTEKIKEQKIKALTKLSGCPTSPNSVKVYLKEVADEIEQSQITTTKKVALETMSEWPCDCTLENEEVAGFDFGNLKIDGPCSRCKGLGIHPVAVRAKEVLNARKAGKEVELYDKILQAGGRLHASLKIIGTLSSRMSGADGLNVQGINHREDVRDCFTLADDGFELDGGDFDSFEIVIADAVYDDPALRREITEMRPCQKCDQKLVIPCKCKKSPCANCDDTKLKTCDECYGSGEATYKIHGLFGMELSGLSYGDVIKSKGTDKDWYTIGKSGVFAMVYGGDWNTLVQKQGINPERAQKAEQNFGRRFPGIARARQMIFDSFCSMRQPNGLGSKVVWKDPSDYIESLLGFKRYFTLENKICKSLFALAQDSPKSWKQLKMKVRRRDRDQFVGGATASSLYAAAFAIQSQNMRAAANHVIQSTGATITKSVQRKIWNLQPSGVHKWLVVPLNVHDEIACPTRANYSKSVEKIVYDAVEEFRPTVPLIKMGWTLGASTWAKMK